MSAELQPEVSVVVPVFNEEGNISLLLKRLGTVLKEIGLPYEIILVDDGSNDATWEVILKECSSSSNIRAFRLSRNFGHQHTLLAGLTKARGRAIVSMDGDLQHPPEFLAHLVAAWQEGYQIVNTMRRDKKVFGWLKRATSRLFYRVFSSLTDVPIAEGSSDFRLIDGKVLEEILKFGDIDLFWRGAVQWVGFRSTTLPYDVEPRFSGSSKYTFSRMLRFGSGAIVSFSVVPLKIGIWLGMITGVLSFAELGYIIISYLSGKTVPGWASTVGITSLLFGVLFVCVGIIGVYVARIHRALQNRPRFIIAEEYHRRSGDGA